MNAARPLAALPLALGLLAACERRGSGPVARPAVNPVPYEALPDRESHGVVIRAVEARVMGGVAARVQLAGPAPGPDLAPAVAALAEIRRVESLLSPYAAGSDVTRLTAAAPGESVPLSPEATEVLLLSRELHARSGGAFDVTVGPLVRAFGFHRDAPPSWPTDGVLAEARRAVGMDKLVIDGPGRRAWKLAHGMRVDTSAIAKGHAVDCAARLLRSRGVLHALVDVGGEMVAVGPKTAGGVPWEAGVERPRPGGAPFEMKLALPSPSGHAALATSADTYQHFEHGGRRYSHIMDPRTGLPRTLGVVSATVLAADCATADGLATALCVLPPEEGVALARSFGAECLLAVEKEDGSLEPASSPGFPALRRPRARRD